MINYTWKYLELFANGDLLEKIRYKLIANDGQNIVESEGLHTFKEGTVNKNLSEVVETDLMQWLEKDTTEDGVNPIKLALESQFKNLESAPKVDFPWLAGTFTIE